MVNVLQVPAGQFPLCAAGSGEMSKTSRHLGVFAKYWQPGNVKTRLASAIGNENAARLYRELARQTLLRLAGCGDQRSLWIWPAKFASEFRALAGDSWDIRCQCPGDLGARISDFFAANLHGPGDSPSSTTHAVLVGTDSPTLPASTIKEAFAAMQSHDCVIGPGTDGGYYLIGLRRFEPAVFAGINWSTPQVLEQTRRRLVENKIDWHELPEWNDIDEPADLDELARQLRALPQPSTHDRQLLAVIEVCSGCHP